MLRVAPVLQTILLQKKAVSHIINSRALTGEKPCNNKAIHALLMHGYATFNMLVPGPQSCCRHKICTTVPSNEHSPWKKRSCDIGEKAKQIAQEIRQNGANVFSFYAIIASEHGFSMHYHLPGPLGGVENRSLRNVANVNV